MSSHSPAVEQHSPDVTYEKTVPTTEVRVTKRKRRPFSGGWTVHTSPMGVEYYYHTDSGVSTWEKPVDLRTEGEAGVADDVFKKRAGQAWQTQTEADYKLNAVKDRRKDQEGGKADDSHGIEGLSGVTTIPAATPAPTSKTCCQLSWRWTYQYSCFPHSCSYCHTVYDCCKVYGAARHFDSATRAGGCTAYYLAPHNALIPTPHNYTHSTAAPRSELPAMPVPVPLWLPHHLPKPERRFFSPLAMCWITPMPHGQPPPPPRRRSKGGGASHPPAPRPRPRSEGETHPLLALPASPPY